MFLCGFVSKGIYEELKTICAALGGFISIDNFVFKVDKAMVSTKGIYEELKTICAALGGFSPIDNFG